VILGTPRNGVNSSKVSASTAEAWAIERVLILLSFLQTRDGFPSHDESKYPNSRSIPLATESYTSRSPSLNTLRQSPATPFLNNAPLSSSSSYSPGASSRVLPSILKGAVTKELDAVLGGSVLRAGPIYLPLLASYHLASEIPDPSQGASNLVGHSALRPLVEFLQTPRHAPTASPQPADLLALFD
jgi:hypothetical protein